MSYISVLVPAFYCSSKDLNSASSFFSKQLCLDPCDYEMIPASPAQAECTEYAVRLLNSSLSLSNIEEVLYHKESMKVFLEKTFESMRAMVSKIGLLETELKEALDNKIQSDRATNQTDEIEHKANVGKLKSLISMQIESSESFRTNTERTLSKIKEEFELIVSEFNEIKRLDSQKQVMANKKYENEENCERKENIDFSKTYTFRTSLTSRSKAANSNKNSASKLNSGVKVFRNKDSKSNIHNMKTNQTSNTIQSTNPVESYSSNQSPNIIARKNLATISNISYTNPIPSSLPSTQMQPQMKMNLNLNNINRANNMILEHASENLNSNSTNDRQFMIGSQVKPMIPKLNLNK